MEHVNTHREFSKSQLTDNAVTVKVDEMLKHKLSQETRPTHGTNVAVILSDFGQVILRPDIRRNRKTLLRLSTN